MNLRLLDEAKKDMRESALWYDQQRAGLGNEFLDAIQDGLEQIEQHPHRYKKLPTGFPEREVRRYLLTQFPYLIVYEILSEEALVVAIPHAKRKPNFWESRLE